MDLNKKRFSRYGSVPDLSQKHKPTKQEITSDMLKELKDHINLMEKIEKFKKPIKQTCCFLSTSRNDGK